MGRVVDMVVLFLGRTKFVVKVSEQSRNSPNRPKNETNPIFGSLILIVTFINTL